jgi:cytosine/adenosine deaminase-related metal-dependent hydrolase
LIRSARVFDSERALLGPERDVYISGGRIAAIYATGSHAEGAATVLEAKGRVLLPGLFDMHAHETSGAGLLHIAAGVTTIRDLGNDNQVLVDIAKRTEKGERIGPQWIRRF